jgi:hypothetical protein
MHSRIAIQRWIAHQAVRNRSKVEDEETGIEEIVMERHQSPQD